MRVSLSNADVRQAVAEYATRRFGWEVEPGQIEMISAPQKSGGPRAEIVLRDLGTMPEADDGE